MFCRRHIPFPQALVSFKKCMPPPLPYFKVSINLFPFPTSPQYFSLICDPFADPIISLHSRDISLFDCHSIDELQQVEYDMYCTIHGSYSTC